MKGAWLRFIARHLNPRTKESARSDPGSRFSIVKHVGRRSGTEYEAVVILAPVPAGFMAELTYGPEVDWFRNISAAGHCEVLHRGELYRVDGISPVSASAGRAAYGPPESWVLTLLRRKHFVLLHVKGRPAA
jgi:hypothetical protein